MNLNQTPPPPIRKVVCDNRTRTVLAVDGYSSTLHRFDAVSRKRLGQRKLALVAVPAGISPLTAKSSRR